MAHAFRAEACHREGILRCKELSLEGPGEFWGETQAGRQAGSFQAGRDAWLGLSGDGSVGPGGLIEGLDHTWSVKQGWLLG